MGNEQSSPSHRGRQQPSGILKECQIDPECLLQNDRWALHHGQVQSTSQTTSVFIAKNDTSSLDNLAKNLRIYRHPHILRYLNCTRSSGTYLFTERVSPLSLEGLSKSQICLGLQKVALALDFLHNVAHVNHGNVSLSSIFVTPEGNWKLAGMYGDLSSKTRTEAKFCPDMSDYGALVETLLQETEVDEGSQEILEMARQEMQSRSKVQATFKQVLAASFFALDDAVHVENFLSDLPLQSPVERAKFFKEELMIRLPRVPVNLVASQLAPLLLSRLVLLDPTAVQHFLPNMLTPKGENTASGALVPEALFREKIIPILINIFHVREVQIRLVLLDFFPNYVGMFTSIQLEEIILPLLLLGIRDSSDRLVSQTLHVLSLLVPILGAGKVIGGRRKKVFSDGRPAPFKDAPEKKSVAVPPNEERQSPIGAEMSELLTLDASDDWEPWEDNELNAPVSNKDDESPTKSANYAQDAPQKEEVDFFADMQPVIENNIHIEAAFSKFAVKDNEETPDFHGWLDEADDGWSSS